MRSAALFTQSRECVGTGRAPYILFASVAQESAGADAPDSGLSVRTGSGSGPVPLEPAAARYAIQLRTTGFSGGVGPYSTISVSAMTPLELFDLWRRSRPLPFRAGRARSARLAAERAARRQRPHLGLQLRHRAAEGLAGPLVSAL